MEQAQHLHILVLMTRTSTKHLMLPPVYGNPIGNVTGNVTGNADTATALATGRTFTIGGDTTALST